MADKGAQIGLFAAVFWSPDTLQEFAMRQDLARVACEFAEQVVLSRGLVNILAAGAYTATSIIDQ